jgi:hypothetical protein
MKRRLRAAGLAAVALGVFTIMLVALSRVELLIMRELYGLAQDAGLLPENPAGAMQILGRYIPGPPPWMRWSVRTLAAFGGMGGAVCLAILVHRRLALPGAFSRLLRSGHAWLRLALAVAIYALLIAPAETYVAPLVRDVVFRAGAAAGCDYFMSGELLVGPDGPFDGGPGAAVFNFAWRWLPWATAHAVAFLVALLVEHRMTATAARRGRCRVCDYHLHAAIGAVCPECGATVPPLLARRG